MAQTVKSYVTSTRVVVTKRWFGSSLLMRELRTLDNKEAEVLYDKIKKSLIPGESVELWNTWTRNRMKSYTESIPEGDLNAVNQ